MKIKEFLSNPKNWTKGALARDGGGEPVPITSSDATCWCVSGAAVFCCSGGGFGRVIAKLEETLADMGYSHLGIAGFNDDPNTTHEKIMELLEKADV